jgi:hypothetical protein
MSRGPGKIERAVAALLDGNPDMAVTAEELARRVYGIVAVEHKHIVSVLRALRRLAQRRPDIGKTWGRDRKRLHNKGGSTVWFNRRNVQSYGLMMLKTRYCAYRIKDAEKQLSCFRHIRKVETEAELLAMLAPGGKYYVYVQPGGEWYRAVHGAVEAPEASAAELGKQQRLLLKALIALGDPGEHQAWSTWTVLNKAWHDPEFRGAIAERVRRWHVDEAARAAAETPQAFDVIGSELDALHREDDGRVMGRSERLLERRRIRDEMKVASRAFALLEKRGLVARWVSGGGASVAITAAGRALIAGPGEVECRPGGEE